MTNQLFASLVTILTGIVGISILAVLVAKSSNTANVISAAGNAFGSDLNIILQGA